MLLLIRICKLVYAPCFSILIAASPSSGPSLVAGFCVADSAVEMVGNNHGIWKAVRAKVRMIIGIHVSVIRASGVY